ncbi:MAG: hypothetical protein ACJAYB_000034 [Psychromonas sp.]|jgi:hypothetical protein
MAIYLPNTKNFTAQELVPPEVFKLIDAHHIHQLFKPGLLQTLYKVRETFGSTTVNTWHHSDDGHTGHRYRGYRPLDCLIGAKSSQHKFGAAVDCVFSGVTAEESRQYILKNPDKFPAITTIEGQVNWLHFDIRPRTTDKIFVFNP